MGTVLAFDFGLKRTGVAVGETALKQSHPLTVIIADDPSKRLLAIAGLVQEWRPELLLVGAPVHIDGQPHDMTERSREFSRSLQKRFGLPVKQADERFSSVTAEAYLRETGKNAKTMKPHLDAVAAQLILQNWFDFPSYENIPALSLA